MGIFGPGFFQSSPVQVGLLLGLTVAVVCGTVGVLTVIRGQSFAGHALADLGATGGSGAFLIGVSQLWGFLAASAVAAGTMRLTGLERPRSRDVATGVVLGAGLGLAALFLYLESSASSTSGAPVTILFGSLFAVDPSLLPVMGGLGLLSLLTMLALFRMLLLSAVNPDMAQARGVPVRWVTLAYLGALALAVALSAMAVGAVLSTALLIGPAATALRLTKSPGKAVVLACALGTLITTASVVLAYDSDYWPPEGQGWPVSFFVVVLVFVAYLATEVRWPRWRRRAA